LWDALTGQERGTLRGHTSPLFALSFTADRQALISVDAEGAVRLWEAAK